MPTVTTPTQTNLAQTNPPPTNPTPTTLPLTTARLVRRVAFGPRTTSTDGLAALAALDPAAVVDRLLAPPGADPWADGSYRIDRDTPRPEARRRAFLALDTWIGAIVAAEFPLDDWLTWTWHGHFVSALPQVRDPQFLVDQMRRFRTARQGTFAELTRAVTVDPAMLLYLDGHGSTGDAPNENYSRELLELFTIGIGNYTEADVAAGARALSGWRVRPGEASAVFDPRRHDDTPHRYLGVDGVHDVDTVVAAIGGHPALPTAIARMLAQHVVGPAVPEDVVDDAADAFRDTGGSIDAVLRSLVTAVVSGVDGGPIILAPVPWLLAALRATDAPRDLRATVPLLQAAGQLPWFPPNVSGWPSGSAWTNAATVVARFRLAVAVATSAADDHPTVTAGDTTRLATALGLPEPFSDGSAAVLDAVDDPRTRLAVALTTPEFVLA